MQNPMNEDEKLPGTVRLYETDVSSTTSDAPLLIPCPSDSPSDPLNWSILRKTWHAALVCSVVLACMDSN